MADHIRLDVKKEIDFVIEESEEAVFITGTTFSMPKFDSSTWGHKHLYIQAYDLTLTENIVAQGKHITINTKILRTSLPFKIDVSGKDGVAHNNAASSGRSLGSDGLQGAEGRKGSDGGSIVLNCQSFNGPILSLIAKGGSGSQGQNGGNGQTGKTGSNASDRGLYNSQSGEGVQGGTGGKGGRAGRGGKGGDGGSPGYITLELGGDVDVSLIQCDVTESIGGIAGRNGKVGSGGSGGTGGKGSSCFERPNRGDTIH